MSFYVTTPIYYVNAEPHLGHAYSTIACDVLARHHRQRGDDTFFLTGTDEHGEPVALAAEREGVTPQELVDRNAPKFREMSERVDASNDFFIRTTDPQHMARVQEVVQRVYDNGFVYEGLYEGWYCPRCADFKTEAEIGPDNTCLIHEIPLERESQQNWFFKLSAFQERLERLYEEQPEFVQPSFRRNEALSFIKGGLQDVSLSRPKLSWGVPVPWDPEQVIYVWWDALLNYYTALSYAREGEDLTERFWPATLHVIAKDILKFHTVYWPAFLMAAGIEPPQRVYVHGYLLMGEKKMSKSLGNVLDPNEVIDRFGSDALRFYCMREVSFGQDGSVSAAGFESRYEIRARERLGQPRVADAGDDRALPRRSRPRGASARSRDRASRASTGSCAACSTTPRSRARSRRSGPGCAGSTPTSRRTSRGSWPRTRRQADRLDSVLYNLAEGIRFLALLLHPYMPESSGKRARRAGRGQPRARRVRRARAAARGSSASRRCFRSSTSVPRP